jgi:D-aminopeptidase
MLLREERIAKCREEISVGTEVIVNDIQNHCDALLMSGIHQSAKVIRGAIGS